MSKVFLSHHQVNEYLRILTESDLLRYDFVRQTYKTTEKGLRFLKIYNQKYQMIKIPQV
jgi:predicted transcriptional regulator